MMTGYLKIFSVIVPLLMSAEGLLAAPQDPGEAFSYKGIVLGAASRDLKKRLPFSAFDFSCVDYEATNADEAWTDLNAGQQMPRFGECLPRTTSPGATPEQQGELGQFFVLGSIPKRTDLNASLTIEASSIGFGIYDGKLAFLTIEYDAGEKGNFDVSSQAEKAHDVMALLRKGVEEKIGPPDTSQSTQTDDIFVLSQNVSAKSIVAAEWERPGGIQIFLEVLNRMDTSYPQFLVRLTAQNKAQSDKLEVLQSRFEHGTPSSQANEVPDAMIRPSF